MGRINTNLLEEIKEEINIEDIDYIKVNDTLLQPTSLASKLI